MDAEIKAVVFADLKKIMEPYGRKLIVQQDTETNYSVNCKKEVKKGMPLFFGSVCINKNYVSYHLMPVYGYPALLEDMSPELQKHMQGKSCFNFKRAEPALFKELKELTASGYELFKDIDISALMKGAKKK